MKRKKKLITGGATGLAIFAGGAVLVADTVAGGRAQGARLPDVCERPPGSGTEIATAKLIIEFNSTDDDIGVHGAFDDHGWAELCVFDPNGTPIAVFDPQGQLNDLTMAGVFFESREPPAIEFSMEDLAAAFPEGTYEVIGTSFDGAILTGAAYFTHDVPAPPEVTAPALAEDAEQPGQPVSRDGLVVEWEPVTATVSGDPVYVVGYEVIVTKENYDDPHGFSRPIYDVHVPAALTALSIPAEFLEPDTVYELEVLALEESGNQTISVGFFLTD